jgi:hypothetical protein
MKNCILLIICICLIFSLNSCSFQYSEINPGATVKIYHVSESWITSKYPNLPDHRTGVFDATGKFPIIYISNDLILCHEIGHLADYYKISYWEAFDLISTKDFYFGRDKIVVEKQK